MVCMTLEIFEWIQKRGIKLKTIAFQNNVNISFVEPHLTNYDFESIIALTIDDGLIDIWDLDGSKMFKKFLQVIETSKFLESLSLTQLDFKALEVLSEYPARYFGVRHLRLQCYENNFWNGEYPIVGVVLYFPKLQSLDLSGTKCLSAVDCNYTFRTVGAGLVKADISYCVMVNDNAVMSIAVHCPKLQSLNVSGCGLLTNASLITVIALFLALQTLKADDCPKIDKSLIVLRSDETAVAVAAPVQVPVQGTWLQFSKQHWCEHKIS